MYEEKWKDPVRVVKEKRWGIDETFKSSLRRFYQTLSIIRWFYYIPNHDLTSFLCTQLDYEEEVKNHKKFQELIRLPFVVTPTLFESECTSEQIVMTKLTGVPLDSLTPEEKKECAKRLVLVILDCIHEGFIHANLGKVLFTKDTIGIFDFGLMITLTAYEKAMLLDILKALVKEDFKSVSEHFCENEDVESFLRYLYNRAMYIDKTFKTAHLFDLERKLSMYFIQLPSVFYKLAVALHSVEPLFKELSITPKTITELLVL
jgi:predicted unusual protein kinase regulating ubiquinone biosynthesis (AarF/ABC1/UbiB family)